MFTDIIKSVFGDRPSVSVLFDCFYCHTRQETIFIPPKKKSAKRKKASDCVAVTCIQCGKRQAVEHVR